MSNPSTADEVRHARREAIFTGLLWCAAAAYTIGYCAVFGYGRSAKDLQFVFGIPDWVFWGIVTPWTVCLIIGVWFSYYFMTDEELGDEESLSDLAGPPEDEGHG